ncbi:hypothetical protein [Flagellimonas sp.]|jgi:hypothetical protein|uniref:hypothetical protein n=1 Tax=Flagellimonas sp. TaxID=2058762 RepID=UPI003BA89226
MFKKFLPKFFSIFFIFFLGCSEQESNDAPPDIDNQEINLDPQDIELSIQDGAYLEDEEILIGLPEGLNYGLIKVYVNSEVILELPKGELIFRVTPENFNDGIVEMKIEIIGNGKVIGTKVANIKIDNNGPQVDFGILIEDSSICEGLSLPLNISDQISEITSIKAFWGQEEIEQFSPMDSDFSFEFDSSKLGIGEQYLKLELEDARNNITVDSILVKLAKKITQINFPDGFVRPGVDEIHVILSASDGSFINSVTHSSGLAETLPICSDIEIGEADEFILTFVSDFEDVVYGIYPYHNLTLDAVGSEINLAKRSGGLSPGTVNIELPDYKEGDYIRASGQWSSALNYQGNILSGHFSRNYTLESLGSNKFFIMNFNPDIIESYKWAFIEDPHTVFKLEDKDFSANDVINSNIEMVGTNLDPFLAVYGFENETHFDAMVSHMIYWNPRLNRFNGYDYSYANIFYDVLYSIKVSNYSIEGIGAPPSTVTVPNSSIDYSFQNNTLSFSGLPNFEVGRAQFRNTDNAHIFVEMYFNGASSDIVMPEMPEFLGNQVTDIVNGGALDIVQCVAEDYTYINNYKEYITNIVVPSIPFYKVSPSRERIFKSSVSTSLLPMTEFPFYERF